MEIQPLTKKLFIKILLIIGNKYKFLIKHIVKICHMGRLGIMFCEVTDSCLLIYVSKIFRSYLDSPLIVTKAPMKCGKFVIGDIFIYD